jgi:GNAT superfamily N-acetyltransferase
LGKIGSKSRMSLPHFPMRSTMVDQHLIRAIEEASFGAWPALRQVLDDGWVLRFAEGHTKRANSVNPTYPCFGDVEAKIARAEAWYRAHGLRTVFRLTPLAEPVDLDQRLAARGYDAIETSCALYHPDLAQVAVPGRVGTVELRLDPTPDAGWLDAYLSLNPLMPPEAATLRRMLDAIVPARQFAWFHDAGQPLAAAFAVVQGDLMGTYDVVTAEAARRRGLMRALLAHLTGWARRCGARRGQLFVVAANAPAQGLYHGLGYTELYRYHYRRAPRS